MILIGQASGFRATRRKLALRDVVTFRDKRFNVGSTDQQKADMIALISPLEFGAQYSRNR